MDWISVKEDPIKTCRCAITNGSEIEIGIYHKASSYTLRMGFGDYWTHRPFHNKEKVTHWMPLPEPPL
jgi:hypothetical protein